MGSDEIHIADLELQVCIGVTERERAVPQRLTVSLVLHPRDGFAGVNDGLDRTINYSAVCAALRELSAGPARQLIETFAEDVAQTVLTRFPNCARVQVELRKFVVPDTKYVAVRLTRP